MRTEGSRFVTVAADADVEEVRPFAATLDFTTLVDTRNDLARVLGFRAIPNGYVFSAGGELRDEVVLRFDLRREPTTACLVRSWLGTDTAPERPASAGGLERSVASSLELFARGTELRTRGELDEGLALWHAAYLADPKSYVVRKQIWRALYPARFGERLDLEWQKEQIAREDAIGFGAANPALPAPSASS